MQHTNTLRCIIAGAALLLGGFTLFAQPAAPIAVDTAWNVGPRTVNISWQYARPDRDGNILCGVMLRDTAQFGPEKIIVYPDYQDIGIAKFSPDGRPLWIRPTRWAKWDNVFSLAVDADGNAFAIYYTQFNPYIDSMLIGGQRFTSHGGPFLVKYSPAGDLLWGLPLGDSTYANTVVADGHGGAVVAGSISGRSIFGPDTLIVPASPVVQNRHAWALISVASNGTFRWARSSVRRKGSVGYDAAFAPNGDVLLTGMLLDVNEADTLTIGSSRITAPGPFIARYHSNGDFLWARGLTVGRIEAYTTTIAFDSAGDMYLGGSYSDLLANSVTGAPYWDTVGTTGKPISYLGNDDIFVTKLTGSGRFLWAETYGGRRSDGITNLHVMPDGGLLMTGELSGGHVFLGGHDYFIRGRSAAFAARLDTGGRPGWVKYYDVSGRDDGAESGRGAWLVSSAFDRQQRLWMFGGFSGAMAFDAFSLGSDPLRGNAVGDVFAIRLAPGSYTRPQSVWTNVDGALPYNMHDFGAPDVQCFTLYAGALYAGLSPGDARPWVWNAGTGIYSSPDNGTSWSRNTGGTRPADTLRYGVTSLAALGDSLYTTTGLLSHSSEYYDKVMVMDRSIPDQWAWLKRSGNPDFYGIVEIDGTLYGQVASYPSSSARGLATWNPATQTWSVPDTAGVGRHSIRRLTGFGEVLLASTWNYEGLYRSTDRGRTWIATVGGLPTDSPGIATTALDLATVGTTMYFSVPEGYSPRFGPGVYRSLDSGAHWSMMNAGLPYEPYGTSDSVPVPIWTFYVRNGVLFAGSERGVSVLLPGAGRWTSISEDLQQCRVNAIIADDTYLYVALNYCGVWRRPLAGIALDVPPEMHAASQENRPFDLTVAPNVPADAARLSFRLPVPMEANLTLYDHTGAAVRTIAAEVMEAGPHELTLTCAGLPSGAYRVRLAAGGRIESAMLVYIR